MKSPSLPFLRSAAGRVRLALLAFALAAAGCASGGGGPRETVYRDWYSPAAIVLPPPTVR